MKFFIKEWSDETTILMTEHGQVIWTFTSMQDAIDGCAEWTGAKTQLPKFARVEHKDRLNNAA